MRAPFEEGPYFSSPAPETNEIGKDLFYRALGYQKEGQYGSAIQSWQQYLKNSPRSYEGHNNLGLAYYDDDQLESGLKSLESAHSLEPSETKIKSNLATVLRFKSRLLKDNQDYHGAIANLRRIAQLSDGEDRRLMELRVVALQGKIFEQVKHANSVSAYQDFIRLYPENYEKVEEAKKRISLLQKKQPKVEFPDLNVGEEEGSFPENVREETFIQEETMTAP